MSGSGKSRFLAALGMTGVGARNDGGGGRNDGVVDEVAGRGGRNDGGGGRNYREGLFGGNSEVDTYRVGKKEGGKWLELLVMTE